MKIEKTTKLKFNSDEIAVLSVACGILQESLKLIETTNSCNEIKPLDEDIEAAWSHLTNVLDSIE